MTDKTTRKPTRKRVSAPSDSWKAFAYFVGKCCDGFGRELLQSGMTDTQARNTIIGLLIDFAAGEACRVARGEGREPDPSKWCKVTNDAIKRAIARTAPKVAARTAEPDERKG